MVRSLGIPALVSVMAACFAALIGGPAWAGEMEFRLVPIGYGSLCGRSCAEIIAAEGEITETTPEQFVAFAREHAGSAQPRNVMFIDSPGGNVVGALRLGQVLRRLGTAVVVARVIPGEGGGVAGGRCMSACVYALMGGKKRVVPPESQVGIHRMFRRETERDPVARSSETHTIFAPNKMVEALARYSGAMGISPQLVATAERISPETVHIVTPAEMLRWRLGRPHF